LDADGHFYIDCINNFTSMIHGYATPSINAVVRDHLALGTAFGAPTPSEIDLADLLVLRLPSVDHIRFTNSCT
jgi:glutamate-1-semialdehyde 2,1-aminomutase